MTVTGVNVYWCCIGATLNLHMYGTAMGDNYNVMAAQKLNDSTAYTCLLWSSASLSDDEMSSDRL